MAARRAGQGDSLRKSGKASGPRRFTGEEREDERAGSTPEGGTNDELWDFPVTIYPSKSSLRILWLFLANIDLETKRSNKRRPERAKTRAFPSTYGAEKGVTQGDLSIEVCESPFPYRHRSLFKELSKSSANPRAGSTAQFWTDGMNCSFQVLIARSSPFISPIWTRSRRARISCSCQRRPRAGWSARSSGPLDW
jgi:hypothetical protein